MRERIYQGKAKVYFNNVRQDIIALIPQGANKILDIGSGSGNLGLALKKNGKASEVVGVELCEACAKEASQKIDRVINGNIEILELSFSDGYFDYIIFGDVLEHLINPWSTLKNLRKYLCNTGYIIASIPNIRYWKIVRDLVFWGEWQYQMMGVLDKTHLRFFTRKTIYQLFESTGFTIEQILCNRIGGKARIVNFLTMGLLECFFTSGYRVVAKKRN